MKSRMNRVLSVGVALAAAVLAVHAQVQQRTLTADVPFQFYVGSHLMPQGAYRVDETANGGIAWLKAMGKGSSQAVTTFSVAGSKETGTARLVFHRYGDNYFLAEIWGASPIGQGLGVSPREKELAQAGVPRTVAVIHVAYHN